ncbi:MAG: type I-E CRISPR-associated protein Cas6/Cse3/CasE [Candidatus Polarisedimenticolaceae bacterium]|nr:type I-E CRISPR-associated protein Cas6/Cse3/CasE [Candidatus Polarisedimenticolaceae bacterium]
MDTSDGAVLAFSLRVNPVVTRKDDSGKQHRHDVVMNAKSEMAYKAMSPEERPALNSGIGPAKAFGCGLMLIRRV